MHPPESGFSAAERDVLRVRRAMRHFPSGGQPVAILCLGQVDAFYDAPMLEREGWDRRREPADCLFENRWGAR
ncbi:hypothetical protein [Thiobacillus sp.]